MKTWQLASPKLLQRAEAEDLKITDNTAKVKITKALLAENDVSVYAGISKAPLPLVLGQFAIGQVTEAGENSFMQKGDRVYFASTTEDELSPDGLQIAGKSKDGFYRDFALVNADEAYVLPASVSDENAFLIEAVALAEKVVDELHISVGQHVLVLGGGLYGNILCQILIYHRAVPIFIDNNKERLERAKKSGIYYTYQFDEALKDNILKITGGKLADGAVYVAFNNRVEPSAVFNFLARDSYVAFCGMRGKPFSVNIETAMRYNLTIKGITECREYVSTAINILANQAVTTSQFPYYTYPEEKLPEKLEEYASLLAKGEQLPEQMDVFKFII